MGQVTPNMSIYIPSDGETNYGASFAAGMLNVDQHDHSGGPDNGVPIASSGIADDSITYEKLNANVVDTDTGLQTSVANPNQIQTAPILTNIYQLGVSSSVGFLAMNGTTMTARTMTGTSNQIDIANPAGVAGNPTFSLSSGFFTGAAWTPNIQIGGSSSGITYTTQLGQYVKMGGVVFFYCNVVLSSKGSNSGDVTISNMPVSTGAAGANEAISIPYFNNMLFSNAYTNLSASLNTSSAVANLFLSNSNNIATPRNMIQSDLSDTSIIKFTGCYLLT